MPNPEYFRQSDRDVVSLQTPEEWPPCFAHKLPKQSNEAKLELLLKENVNIYGRHDSGSLEARGQLQAREANYDHLNAE